MLRLDSPSSSFDISDFETPCLPMRINGTKRRESVAKAVVAMKVLVYATSGGSFNPIPSSYDDQIAVVTPIPRGTARRLAV